LTVELEEARVTIVMGLDQHRGQITAEWIDAATGEVSRARVAPAHREPVRHFLSRFRDRELEVALEATTGWRFVVEELRAIGAGVHLAEPAETAARRGNKKRAESDRADARHRARRRRRRARTAAVARHVCWRPAEGPI
jgi:transposase